MHRWLSALATAHVVVLLAGSGLAENAQTDSPTDSRAPAPGSAPVELGGHAGIVHRPAEGGGVTYKPGLAWGGSGRIRFTEHLGLRVLAGLEYHAVDLKGSSLGLEGSVKQPDLEGIRLAGEFCGRLPLAQHWVLELGAGLGWARFEAAPLTAPDVDAVLGTRSGVLLEVPISPRLTWHVVLSRVAISLTGTYAIALPSQTGNLFNTSGEYTQVLRQDTGELVNLEGFPEFTDSLGGFLAIDLLL